MAHADKQPSPMPRKFLQGGCSEPNPNFAYDTFRKEFYFFYGTLMDSSTLATILNLERRPRLFSAKVIGCHCMMWDQYPALLDGPPDTAVHGVAYEVQSRKDRELLQEYEIDNFAIEPCLIEFEDGRKTIGRTFKWNADTSLLRESNFDLNDWQTNKLGT